MQEVENSSEEVTGRLIRLDHNVLVKIGYLRSPVSEEILSSAPHVPILNHLFLAYIAWVTQLCVQILLVNGTLVETGCLSFLHMKTVCTPAARKGNPDVVTEWKLEEPYQAQPSIQVAHIVQYSGILCRGSVPRRHIYSNPWNHPYIKHPSDSGASALSRPCPVSKVESFEGPLSTQTLGCSHKILWELAGPSGFHEILHNHLPGFQLECMQWRTIKMLKGLESKPHEEQLRESARREDWEVIG